MKRNNLHMLIQFWLPTCSICRNLVIFRNWAKNIPKKSIGSTKQNVWDDRIKITDFFFFKGLLKLTL
jgi:hypothetical protein